MLRTILLAFSISFALMQYSGAQEGEPIYRNGLVALVEDKPITLQQVDIQSRQYFDEKVTNESVEKEMAFKVFQSLVEKEIILKEFERMKGNIPESYAEQKFDEILKQKFDGDQRRLSEVLRSQGLSIREYKRNIRENAIVEYMFSQNVVVPSAVSPKDIFAYYTEHRSEFFKPQEFTFDQIAIPNTQWSLQNEMLQLVNAGKSNEEIWDWIRLKPEIKVSEFIGISSVDVLPQIAEALEPTSMGKFSSKPVQLGEFSIFLFFKKVEPKRQLSLLECSKQIENFLRSRNIEKAREAWVETLKKKSFYKVL